MDNHLFLRLLVFSLSFFPIYTEYTHIYLPLLVSLSLSLFMCACPWASEEERRSLVQMIDARKKSTGLVRASLEDKR